VSFHPYLSFAGNARDAFTRYQEIFGGELFVMSGDDAPPGAGPEDWKGVMHAALTIGDDVLMGADDPSGGFTGTVHGMCVNWSTPDAGDAKRIFDALAEGGEVQMPIGETFFSPAFGMCIDRFGTPWMVAAAAPEA
jgi:PhnB protein